MSFRVLGLLGEMLFFKGAGSLCMLAFFIRQSVEQFAGGHIVRSAGGAIVETAGFHLHDFGLPSRGAHSKWAHHPNRPALQESTHVFAANGWDLLAKTLPEQSQKAVAMASLFLAHLLEHLRAGGIGFAQGIGKFAIDTAVLFLVGDRDGQNLPAPSNP